MAELVPQVVGAVSRSIADRLLADIDLASSAGTNVEDVTDAITRLTSIRTDLEASMRRLPQRRRPEEVRDWLSRVDGAEKRVAKLRRDYQRRCCSCGCGGGGGAFSLNVFASYAISRRACHERHRLAALAGECDRVRSLVAGAPRPSSGGAKAVPSTVVGMEGYLEEALACLDGRDAGVVAICGMAGVGKSTLLRRINNVFVQDPDRRDEFDYVIWLDAPRDCAIGKLQDAMADRLGLSALPDGGVLDHRARPIFEILRDASFLLLLDGLTKPVYLADIGVPHLVHDDRRRQKVAMTARTKGVCGRMSSSQRIDMQCLDSHHSWTLFRAVARDETINADPRIPELAKEVAGRCGGLPLALTAVGGAMRCRKHPQEWVSTVSALRNLELDKIPGMDTGEKPAAMLRVLQESYEDLRHPVLQECSIATSLWPEDHAIDKNELVECWIGLGLVGESLPMDEAVRTGLAVVNELEEANLLLPGDAAGEVKLHGVTRAVALWIARDLGRAPNRWVVHTGGVSLRSRQKLAEFFERARGAERVSAMRSSVELLRPMPPSSPCRSLSVLMLQHNAALRDIPGGFLLGVPALTYLDASFTAVREVPPEIDALSSLRYLNLSSTPLESVPPELGKLGQLRQLLLRHTAHLSMIPAGVLRGLPSLDVLDVCPSRYTEWCGAGGGASLDEVRSSSAFLRSLGIAVATLAGLRTLRGLDNVRTRRLLVTRVAATAPSVTLRPSALSLLETLHELTVANCSGLQELEIAGDDDGTRRSTWWRLPELRKLEIDELHELRTVRWTRTDVGAFLPALRWVKISRCNMLRSVSWVVQLPCLEHLELSHCSEMVHVVDDAEEEERQKGELPEARTFRCLRMLLLVELPVMSSISGGAATSFPRLETLQIAGCNSLGELPVELHKKLKI
ncbi:disease resistance protein RPS2-like [Oryza brachyantha]|uniref:disease resistance protein RPS2-like n=1 Tax=Oryza brachyantha TaxID=4533 RepID=UPI001ADD3A53|nr:disease resistance protein RPS2-like [Oryza brachyantha]